jgi:hypothetical protein
LVKKTHTKRVMGALGARNDCALENPQRKASFKLAVTKARDM